MDRMKDTYEMDMEIKILEGDEAEAHEAHEAHSGGVGLDKHIPDDSDATTNQAQKSNNIGVNNQEIPTKRDTSYTQKAPQVPQAPQMLQEPANINKPKLYFLGGRYHCESCSDKGDKPYMDEHKCNGKESNK
jgi:hypothetical protein